MFDKTSKTLLLFAAIPMVALTGLSLIGVVSNIIQIISSGGVNTWYFWFDYGLLLIAYIICFASILRGLIRLIKNNKDPIAPLCVGFGALPFFSGITSIVTRVYYEQPFAINAVLSILTLISGFLLIVASGLLKKKPSAARDCAVGGAFVFAAIEGASVVMSFAFGVEPSAFLAANVILTVIIVFLEVACYICFGVFHLRNKGGAPIASSAPTGQGGLESPSSSKYEEAKAEERVAEDQPHLDNSQGEAQDEDNWTPPSLF